MTLAVLRSEPFTITKLTGKKSVWLLKLPYMWSHDVLDVSWIGSFVEKLMTLRVAVPVHTEMIAVTENGKKVFKIERIILHRRRE